jgi:hypothetical protein
VDLEIKVFEVGLGRVCEELTYGDSLDEVFVCRGHEPVIAGLTRALETRARGKVGHYLREGGNTISVILWFRLRRLASSARRR